MNPPSPNSHKSLNKGFKTISLFLKPVQSLISSRSLREQLLIKTLLFVLGAYVLWNTAVSPALESLGKSASRAQILNRQWSELNGLQSQLKSFKEIGIMGTAEAVEKLKTLTTQLGPLNKITFQDSTAKLQLKGLSPDGLAQLLPALRASAQAQVTAASLKLDPQTKLWEGTLTLGLPGSSVEGSPSSSSSPTRP
jgi:type II secretory pathway component PulM